MNDKEVHKFGDYLRDAIFAASDGMITTFAVVSGSAGASLSPNVAIILGFANLFADGISMASGTFLGVKSEIDFEKSQGDRHSMEAAPIMQGVITFLAFVTFGFLPLVPYVFNISHTHKFLLSAAVVFIAMFIVGLIRGNFTKSKPWKSGIETVIVGGFAATVSFLVGFLIDRYFL